MNDIKVSITYTNDNGEEQSIEFYSRNSLKMISTVTEIVLKDIVEYDPKNKKKNGIDESSMNDFKDAINDGFDSYFSMKS